jgi:hypothetical protein
MTDVELWGVMNARFTNHAAASVDRAELQRFTAGAAGRSGAEVRRARLMMSFVLYFGMDPSPVSRRYSA